MTILIDTRTQTLWEQTRPSPEEFREALQQAFDEREDDE
jgi:hypothetical protein